MGRIMIRVGIPTLKFKRSNGEWQEISLTTGGIDKLTHYRNDGTNKHSFEFKVFNSKKVLEIGEVVDIQLVFSPYGYGECEVKEYPNLMVEEIAHTLSTRIRPEMFFYKLSDLVPPAEDEE